jgi:hypothetical protein
VAPTVEDAENAADVGGIADRSAETAANMAERLFDQSREAVWSGARAAMSMSDRLADVSYGGTLPLMNDASRMMGVYQHTGEDTAQSLQALFATTLSLGSGLQRMHQAWLGVVNRALSIVSQAPEAFRNSKSMSELAEAQRRLCVEFVNSSVEANLKMLQLMEQVARDAMGHLDEKPGRRG